MEAEQGVASRAIKATLFARMHVGANGRETCRLTPLIGDNKAFYEAVSQDTGGQEGATRTPCATPTEVRASQLQFALDTLVVTSREH